MTFGSLTVTARKVTLGAFVLPKSIVDRLTNHIPSLSLPGAACPPHLKKKVKACGDCYFIGKDPAVPEIGD